MDNGATPFEVVSREPKVRLLEVVRVNRITPKMVRVTFGGNQLAGYESLGADDDFRVFFPLPGQERPTLPSLGATSGFAWPDDAPRPPNREYTPRRYNAAANELDVDFV